MKELRMILLSEKGIRGLGSEGGSERTERSEG